MEASLHYGKQKSGGAKLPDFLSVLDRGYHHIGRLSFPTPLTEASDLKHYVYERLSDLDIEIASEGWGREGLVIDFYNHHDLTLFSLGFKGPRVG